MWQQVLVDQLPKALIGLLIPAINALWKLLRDSTVQQRRDRLRNRVTELSTHRRALAEMAQTPATARALAEVDTELDGTLSKLAGLDPIHSPAQPHVQPRRSSFARALLLYAPSTASGWIIHVLFFLNVSFVFFGVIGVLSEPQDPELLTGLIVFAAMCIPAALLWRSATRRHDAGLIRTGELKSERSPADVRETSPRSLSARLFLLFIPLTNRAFALHVFFFFSVLIAFVSLVQALDPANDDPQSDLVASLVFFIVATLLRWRAVALDTVARQSGATAMHVRRRKAYLFARGCFWYATFTLPLWIASPFLDEPDPFSSENLSWALPFIGAAVCVCVLLAVCARGWSRTIAAEIPTTPSPVGPVRTVLLLYVPTQPSGWCATLGVAVGVAGSIGILRYFWPWGYEWPDVMGLIFILGNLGALIVTAHGWATAYRPSVAPRDSTAVIAG